MDLNPERLAEIDSIANQSVDFRISDTQGRRIIVDRLTALVASLKTDLAAELESGTGESADTLERTIASLGDVLAPLVRWSDRWEPSDRWARINAGRALGDLKASLATWTVDATPKAPRPS